MESQVDRQHTEVRAVIERYFTGVDARDWEVLAQCFAPDAEMSFVASDPDGGGGHWARGWDRIRASMAGLVQFLSSTHVIGNVAVRSIDEETAEAVTNAVAYLVDAVEEGPDRILVRGLRYHDRLARRGEGWRLQRRIHIPIWQYAVPSAPMTLQSVEADADARLDRQAAVATPKEDQG